MTPRLQDSVDQLERVTSGLLALVSPGKVPGTMWPRPLTQGSLLPSDARAKGLQGE